MEWDELVDKLTRMETECKASWDCLREIATHDSSSQFKAKLSDFLSDVAERIIVLKIVHKRVLNRFHKFLLFLGYPPNMASDVKVNVFCKTLSEFALEFRTTREKVLQQKEKKANQKERKKTRGKMILETEKFAKPPRIEKQREDDLHKVLHNGYATEEEKSSSMLLPGAKVRKRYSLGTLRLMMIIMV